MPWKKIKQKIGMMEGARLSTTLLLVAGAARIGASLYKLIVFLRRMSAPTCLDMQGSSGDLSRHPESISRVSC